MDTPPLSGLSYPLSSARQRASAAARPDLYAAETAFRAARLARQARHRRTAWSRGACYGHDHGAVLAALDSTGGRYRGVAVIEPEIAETTLADMHARGIRGIRLGLMSHLGGPADPARMLAILDRIRPYSNALVHGKLADVVSALHHLVPAGVPLVIDRHGTRAGFRRHRLPAVSCARSLSGRAARLDQGLAGRTALPMA